MKYNSKSLCISALSIAGVLPLMANIQVSKEKKQCEPKRYNIVFIMSDDHSYQMISCYDKRYIQTPNIDRIAQSGVQFGQSFVANSISGPSRACMLTGKHSHKNGKLNNETSFDGNQQTMPKILQANGYATAIFGKWHLESLPQGFDQWCIFPGQGDYYDSNFIRPNNHGGADTTRIKGYVTNIVTDMGLDWLKKHDTKKPFALFIHHKAAHRIWMSDTTDLNKFEDRVLPLPETFYDDYNSRKAAALQEMSIDKDMTMMYDLKMYLPGMETKGLDAWYANSKGTGILDRLKPDVRKKWDAFYEPIAKDFYKKKLTDKELAEWKYQRYMRDYMKVITSLDRNIGRVFDYLKEHNLLDNTIVIYTSDQGFYMGEHGWFDKRFMYEESMRTPMVMHLPKGLDRRGVVNALVQNIDTAPTLLDLANVPIPEDMQGQSMVPLLKNAEADKSFRKGLYYHFYEYPAEHAVRRHYGIRGERYKLIHFYNDIDEWELFDLKNDPNELHNVYNKPEYKSVQDSMYRELIKLEKKYDAPIIDVYPAKK